MLNHPIPSNETARLEALKSYEILDTDADERLDNLTKLASEICEVPICLISLVDETRQWFKSSVGLSVSETPRKISFCQHSIMQDELMQVENALEDERFENNILVKDNPNIRFYAGQPLIDKDGFALGTLCVIDSKPKKLSKHQERALKILSHEVIQAIEKAKLEKERIKYNRFFNMSVDLLCIADVDGYFKQVNSSFSKLLGYSNEELLGQPFVNFIHPEDIDATLKEVEKLAQGATTLGFENRYRKKNGSYVWLEWAAHPDSESSNLFAIARDISDIKEAYDKLELSNQNLDQFAYIVSHDLKAPLRAINGLVSFLQEDLNGKLDKNSEENFNLVKNRSERMSMMIDGILSYTKAVNGSIDKTEIETKKLIENTFSQLNYEGKFTLNVMSPLPTVHFNEHQFSQIIQNIIDNSFKHHHRETGVITVNLEEREIDYLFTIEDDGPGINKNSESKIFEMFQTLQPKNGSEKGGIGLTIVKKIIEDNGGRIYCESELGKGTKITFSLLK